MTDSTISGNNCTGIVNRYGGTATVNGCTVNGNTGSAAYSVVGGIVNSGTLSLKNTIVAGNSPSDVSGAFTSQTCNLIGNGTGSTGLTNGVNGDKVGTAGSPIDPLLGPLQDNGGPTQTMALLAGSPAIDAGNNSSAPAIDQRGTTRILDGNGDGTATIDIGAFELDPGPVISAVAVGEATPQNAKLESNEKLVVTWSAVNGVASQTLTIDGQATTPIGGPYGGMYYSCTFGPLAAGTHNFVIQANNATGGSSSYNGSFDVLAPVVVPPEISSVVVAENDAPKNGKLESNEKLVVTWGAASRQRRRLAFGDDRRQHNHAGLRTVWRRILCRGFRPAGGRKPRTGDSGHR